MRSWTLLIAVGIVALLAIPTAASSGGSARASPPALPAPCSPAVLVWDGGSIIRGDVPSGGMDYPSQTTPLLRRSCVSFNSGSSNAMWTGMLADGATEVDARYDGDADANVCIVMGGAADLAAGRDAGDVYEDLARYCAARHAAGFQVVAVTLLPRDRLGFNEACRAYNSLVRSRWTEIADGLADVAADDRIGDPGDNHDGTYYHSDAVHPNDAGNGVMASVTAPVLESLEWRSDITPPTTTASGADGLWHRDAVVVTLTASDDPRGSGVVATEYRLDDGSWTTGTECLVAAPADHSADGEHSVAYRSTDAAGNTESARSSIVRIDTREPLGSLQLAGGAAATDTAQVTAASLVTDINGVVAMRFSGDGRATWGDWLAYASSRALTLQAGDGERTVWAQYSDPAGNLLETADAIMVRTRPIDTVAPTTVASGVDDRWHKKAVRVTLAATDGPGGSGVQTTESRLDGGPWRAGAVCTVRAPADHSRDGVHVVAYRSSDAAGNREAVRRCAVRIDTEGPTTSAVAADGVRGRGTALRFRVRDALSPAAKAVRLIIEDARGTTVRRFAFASCALARWHWVEWRPESRGAYRLRVYAKDMAGNGQRSVASAEFVVR